MIAAFEGGMTPSSNAAVAASTATKGGEKPAFTMRGISMVPMAVIAARIEPQNAAKNAIASTIEMPRPPGQCPTSATHRSTRRRAMPPATMT